MPTLWGRVPDLMGKGNDLMGKAIDSKDKGAGPIREVLKQNSR
jgi:hypothetical protein